MHTTARRTTTALFALALTVVTAGFAPAAAAASGDGATLRIVPVAGRQIPVDVANGLYEMRGSLVGDWRYIPTRVLHDSPTLYAEAGVEVFDGCIDRRPRDGTCTARDYNGQLHLSFVYWASYDLNGDLIQGQCVHPITGGRGAFAGSRGVLGMVDRPVGAEVKTTYAGAIRLNAVPSEGDAPTPASAGAATAAAATAAAAATTSAAVGQQGTSVAPVRSGC